MPHDGRSQQHRRTLARIYLTMSTAVRSPKLRRPLPLRAGARLAEASLPFPEGERSAETARVLA